jgi:hypothetical protein
MAGRAPETPQREPLYDWRTSVGFAVAGTVVAVGLIVLFTYVVDWVGQFWSQVIYFLAVFGVIVALAVQHRREDLADPLRRTRAASPITPVGLPGPFVITQALGVLGIAMLAVGALVGGDRGLVWLFSGLVLLLVGGVGLVFWLAGLAGRRARAQR